METLPPLPRCEPSAPSRSRDLPPVPSVFEVLPPGEFTLILVFAIFAPILAGVLTYLVVSHYETVFNPSMLVWLIIPLPWYLLRLCWKYRVDADCFWIERLLRSERVSWSQLWSARETFWGLHVSYQAGRGRWQ